MSKHVTIPIPIYEMNLILSIGETDDQLWDNLKKLGMTKKAFSDCLYPNSTNGRAIFFQPCTCFIRLRNSKLTPHYHGLIAHEIFHIATFIMNEVGMTLSGDSDEAYAYLISYLTEQIYKNL